MAQEIRKKLHVKHSDEACVFGDVMVIQLCDSNVDACTKILT